MREGDELLVSPACFAAMQEAIASAEDPDQGAYLALRAAGLSDDEIVARMGREMRIVVAWEFAR